MCYFNSVCLETKLDVGIKQWMIYYFFDFCISSEYGKTHFQID